LATLTAGDTYPDGTFAAAVSSAERASIAAGFELAPAVRVGEAIGRSAAKDATTEAAKLFAGKP
ncbi:MAG TPA: hypothetical protein VF407_01790, partial [Polyangiaceae bacterium]